MNKLSCFVFVIVGLFSACTDESDFKQEYPEEIKKAGYEGKFDEAKWKMYEFYCDCFSDVCVYKKNQITDTIEKAVSPIITELFFGRCDTKHDTVSISFFFGDINTKTSVINTCPPLYAVYFIGNSDSIKLLEFGDVWFMTYQEAYKAYDWKRKEILFPILLKAQESKLDKWLLHEARKRKVLQ